MEIFNPFRSREYTPERKIAHTDQDKTEEKETAKYILKTNTGEPLILYRGSSSALDATYNKNQLGFSTGAPSAQEAFFFTDRRKTADYYSRGDNPNKEHAVSMGGIPHIDEANLIMRNPFVYDFKGEFFRDKTYYGLIKRAKENGHDGFIFKNTFDAGEYGRLDAMIRSRLFAETIYGVFEPEQIVLIKQTETVSPRKKQTIKVHPWARTEEFKKRELLRKKEQLGP